MICTERMLEHMNIEDYVSMESIAVHKFEAMVLIFHYLLFVMLILMQNREKKVSKSEERYIVDFSNVAYHRPE